MDQQKNQAPVPSSLLEGIQGEVSAENAPLLNFITAHASLIAGCVLLILLVLGGMGVWKWYHGGKEKEARAELARITMQLKGADRNRALADLAEKAPSGTRLFIYLTLAQNAQEDGDPVLAGEAYAKAAALAGDGPLGMTAALGSAGSLLMQSKYEQALALLQEFEQKWADAGQSMQFRQMLAEAAARSGKLELARDLYLKLAQEIHAPEAAYFQTRADAIAKEISARGASTGASR